MKLRLRNTPGPPVLGHNMHCLRGHARLTFIKENYHTGDALDIGSGQGAFALWLHRQGCRTTMLDVLPVNPPDADIEVLQMDLYDLDGSEKRYDTILFMEIVEHVEDPGLALDLCYRLLAPGGVLLVTTPWVANWDKEADHLWRFDEEGIEELLARYDAHIWSDDTFVYAVVEKTKMTIDPNMDLWARFKGLEIATLRMLDLGCGYNKNRISRTVLALPFQHLTSVDVYPPCLEALRNRIVVAKEHVIVQDEILHYLAEPGLEFDVTLLLDVWQHFTSDNAKKLLTAIETVTRKRVIIFLPIGRCPRKIHANPYDTHKSTWTVEDLAALGFTVELMPGFHKHFQPPVDAAWAVKNL